MDSGFLLHLGDERLDDPRLFGLLPPPRLDAAQPCDDLADRLGKLGTCWVVVIVTNEYQGLAL